MATSSKKTPAKVATKKAVAAKPTKDTKVLKIPVHTKVSTVKLISFGVTATIPTQQYGNIMPSIVVEAASIEEARAVVMPFMEELYAQYAEKPRDGSKLAFLGKVTETVKEVAPIAAPAPAPAPTQPVAASPAPKAPEASDSSVQAPEAAPAPSGSAPKSEFAARAEKMIGLAMTEEAAQKILTQIQNSEKIPEHEKGDLLTMVEAKITDFQSNIW